MIVEFWNVTPLVPPPVLSLSYSGLESEMAGQLVHELFQPRHTDSNALISIDSGYLSLLEEASAYLMLQWKS